MKEYIEKIRTECAKIKKPFVFNPEEDKDEELQTASILFVTKKNNKDYLVDAFVMTSHFQYHMEVMDEAERLLVKKFPKLAGKDYIDFSEEQQDELDNLMDEIYENESVHVQEFISEDLEENENFIEMEVGLNREELTIEVLEKLVNDYNQNKLKLDDTALSFTEEFEEE
ncbi:MAG: hypothetical protein EAZ85_07445 [Bacteroidetes bacterium]|nr:MAG: hypothetical protein EAZ85_07445 [Bacteroidota bacterium]TAG86244.1 MAG: hypothetical protein EAZ20_13210 [Bacteroidota bacterium]